MFQNLEKKSEKLDLGTSASWQSEQGRSANTTGMPDHLKSNLESLSGFDMSDVRVHRNSDRPAGIGALAYAQGSDIHLGPGQDQHLGHEAWHVVQQKQGRVKPTIQLKNHLSINDETGLEKEADIMGDRAIQSAYIPNTTTKLQTGTCQEPVAQRVLVTPTGSKANTKIDSAVEVLLASDKTAQAVHASRRVALLVNRADSPTEVWEKTKWNKAKFEYIASQFCSFPEDVDYLVNINDDQLDGLDEGFEASYPSTLFSLPPTVTAASEAPESFLSPEILDQLAALNLPSSNPGVFTPRSILVSDIPPPLGDFQLPAPSRPLPKTSLALKTVLLHELGHVLQHETLRNREGVSSSPAVTVDISALNSAQSEGDIESSIWTKTRKQLNAFNTWVSQNSGEFSEGEVGKLKALVKRAQLLLSPWIEYDVMTNVEHPFALENGEPIREKHGEETALGLSKGPSFSPAAIGVGSYLESQRLSLKSLKEKMIKNAQKMSFGLVGVIAEIKGLSEEMMKQYDE